MKFVELGDVAAVFNGKTPAKSEQRTSGHPVLKVRDINGCGSFCGFFESFVDPEFAARYSAKHAVMGDTVILNAAHQASHVASKVALLKSDVAGAMLTGEWLAIRPSKEIDSTYLHYWITSEAIRTSLKGAVKGIHLYPRDVSKFKLALPPLPEQRRIAAILDHAATLRAKRRQVIACLDDLAQSIFLEMFGDPDLYVESENTLRFSDVANLQGGRNLVANDGQAQSKYRVLKISAVTSGQFNPSESKPALPVSECVDSVLELPGVDQGSQDVVVEVAEAQGDAA